MVIRASTVVWLFASIVFSDAFAGHVLTGEALSSQSEINPHAWGDDADFIGGSVTRAVFTRAVVNREPVDNLETVPGNITFLYYFTELKGFTGEVITHRWEFEGHVVAETRFEIGGPRWRIWSSRPLPPDRVGAWRVSVLDFQGRIVAVSDFVHGATASVVP